MFKKILVFVLNIISWDNLLEIILELGKGLMIEWLSGKNWSIKAEALTICLYVLAMKLGITWSKETKTVKDDMLVETIIGMCKDLAHVKGFDLPKLS